MVVLGGVGGRLVACGAWRGGSLLIVISAFYAAAFRFTPPPRFVPRAMLVAVALGALAIAEPYFLGPQFAQLRVVERSMRMPALEAVAAPVLTAAERFRLERGRPPNDNEELSPTGWISAGQFRVTSDSELVIEPGGWPSVGLSLRIAPDRTEADRLWCSPRTHTAYAHDNEWRRSDWIYRDNPVRDSD